MRILTIVFLSLLLLIACSHRSPVESVPIEPLAEGGLICELEPGLCEQRCADCPDQTACFAAGGHCQAANVSYDDKGDVAGDVFDPGCHYIYEGNAACQGDPKRFSQDDCGIQNPDLILEWTISACHGPTGDLSLFDCDKICRQLGAGGGTCKTVANACAQGWNSAQCECDRPVPGPNPTVSGLR